MPLKKGGRTAKIQHVYIYIADLNGPIARLRA
jgi:hypothetical protein